VPTALDYYPLSAAPCQVTGIICPNGAGKTKLLNAACRLVKPQFRNDLFDSRELTGHAHRPAGRGVARTLQGGGRFRGFFPRRRNTSWFGATQTARGPGFWSGFFGLPSRNRDERRHA